MSKTKRIAVDGVLAALYFALSALTFTVGNLQLRFSNILKWCENRREGMYI